VAMDIKIIKAQYGSCVGYENELLQSKKCIIESVHKFTFANFLNLGILATTTF